MRERAERSAKMPVDDSKFDSIVDSDDEAESCLLYTSDAADE